MYDTANRLVVQKKPLITLDTPLGEIPRYWLRFVEPKILRGSFLPCWIWVGRTQRFGHNTEYHKYEYPTMKVPKDEYDERKGTREVYVHRWVAAMFWDFPDNFMVYRTCNVSNCVNPNHFAISYRNDPEFM